LFGDLVADSLKITARLNILDLHPRRGRLGSQVPRAGPARHLDVSDPGDELSHQLFHGPC
jgi:hypothetical protein